MTRVGSQRHSKKKMILLCSDSQAALKVLRAAKTTAPLVRQCQQASNDISTRHAVGLYRVPGHDEEEMKSLTSLQGVVLFSGLLDLSLS
jgi:hypothetical protein